MRNEWMLAAAVAAALMASAAAPARAQPADAAVPATPAPSTPAPSTPAPLTPATREYVTREEYERLRSELDDVRRRVDDSAAAPAARESGRRGAGPLFDGDRFLVTGYMQAGFVDARAGDSTFTAGLNPIFLWRINDRIFVEAEVELELTNEDDEGTTESNLEYANVNFVLNDYATVRAGKFLTPFGQFPERLHPAWINKLPDFPLVYNEEGGLVPFSSLGVEVRGAVPLRHDGADSKLVYAAYLANGPSLVTDDDEGAGTLSDANFDDINSNKTVGGRLGYLPVPQFEVGASVMAGDVDDGVSAVLWGVDASYVRDSDLLRGTIDARAEWVWSNVETTTFDEEGEAGFGPLRFSNKRHGGYVQLAYRPTQADSRVLRNLEFVGRYDNLRVPGSAPGLPSSQRLTLGADYWVTNNVVIKAAYRLDDPNRGEHDNALFLQAAVGF